MLTTIVPVESSRFIWKSNVCLSITALACLLIPGARSNMQRSRLWHAWRPPVRAVLVQDHGIDLVSRVALETELRVDNGVIELVFGAGINRECGLPGKQCIQLPVFESDFEHHTGRELVAPDVLPKCGHIEMDRMMAVCLFDGRGVELLSR